MSGSSEHVKCPLFLSAALRGEPRSAAEPAHAAASALSSNLPFGSYRPSSWRPWKTALPPSSYSRTSTLARTQWHRCGWGEICNLLTRTSR